MQALEELRGAKAAGGIAVEGKALIALDVAARRFSAITGQEPATPVPHPPAGWPSAPVDRGGVVAALWAPEIDSESFEGTRAFWIPGCRILPRVRGERTRV